MISLRHREILQTLWKYGRLSRWELHEQTGMTPNGVGSVVDAMLQANLVRECPPETAKMGRPRIPLEIDPVSNHVTGLAFSPGRVDVAQLGLTGELLGRSTTRESGSPSQLVGAAVELLEKYSNEGTQEIGVTSPGFVDPALKKILFSSAFPGHNGESLWPLFEAAGAKPAVLGNDMHAVAARWLLTHRAEQDQDILLVRFADGHLGSALLVDGKPNHGCVTGGNELGHTRFPGIDTEKCFCGHVGCLERIVSTNFLTRHGDPHESPQIDLYARIERLHSLGEDPPLALLIDLLAQSLANAANFLRLDRLVLMSPYSHCNTFISELKAAIRRRLMPPLVDLIEIEIWTQALAGPAENAAWLALADFLYGGWGAPEKELQSSLAKSVLNE